MGMSTHVVGFKPPDEKWRKMKKILDACCEAGVPIPEEVDDYFNGEKPDEAGVEINQRTLEQAGVLREHNAEMQNGYEVDITKLPKDVKIIRFYNSY